MEGLDMNANICESKTLNANTFSDSFQASFLIHAGLDREWVMEKGKRRKELVYPWRKQVP